LLTCQSLFLCSSICLRFFVFLSLPLFVFPSIFLSFSVLQSISVSFFLFIWTRFHLSLCVSHLISVCFEDHSLSMFSEITSYVSLSLSLSLSLCLSINLSLFLCSAIYLNSVSFVFSIRLRRLDNPLSKSSSVFPRALNPILGFVHTLGNSEFFHYLNCKYFQFQ
jgi:hypothetical protein